MRITTKVPFVKKYKFLSGDSSLFYNKEHQDENHKKTT